MWDLRELTHEQKPRLWRLPARRGPVTVHPTRWGVGPRRSSYTYTYTPVICSVAVTWYMLYLTRLHNILPGMRVWPAVVDQRAALPPGKYADGPIIRAKRVSN